MSSGPTRVMMSRSKNHSLMVIGCNDETNAKVVNRASTRRGDDVDHYTIEGNAVDGVSVQRK